MSIIKTKLNTLIQILKEMDQVLIAYSGGVDSTFLMKVAKDTLADQVLAVTASSETYSERELEQAKSICQQLGIRLKIIPTKELEYPNFASNPVNRCYYCKKELFSELRVVADKENITFIADGTNADDLDDYRPGLIALEELAIRSPLKEAGLTKRDIRELSKKMNLPTWNKPAIACMASRFPYGTEITNEKLRMVERAENYLHDLGIKQVRVRHHGTIARIEVTQEDFPIFISDIEGKKIVDHIKQIGYKYIALDLEGYRTGSMNEVLEGDGN
jgi:uncharacterized protein